MSTASRPRHLAAPPLVEGEQLDQAEFHRRYEAMPPDTRAELIGGVVHMPSPLGLAHGEAHVPAIVWLSYYAESTPGVQVIDNTTTILGRESEPQPDALLRILPECGGRTRTELGFLRGAPELVVEIAKATRFVDLGPKRSDYEKAGVLEYVMRALDPDEVVWFRQGKSGLVQVGCNANGLFSSKAFPGLWLDRRALENGDTRRICAVLDQGLATAEHRRFVARLAKARGAH
jgi:Uma2 family endonuclease